MVEVSLRLVVSTSDFYLDKFISNLAHLLNIDPGSGRAPRASRALVWDRVTAMVGGSTKTVWSDLATPVGRVVTGSRDNTARIWDTTRS